MKLFLLLLATFAFADVEAPPPPPPTGSFATRPAPSATEDIAKEFENLTKQAEQVLGQAEQLQKLQPLAGQQIDLVKQKALRLATDDRFLQSAKDLWQSPNRQNLLLAQLGWFLFMLLFKAWRQGAAGHWFKRMLVGFACTLLTWIGLVYVIPLVMLGEPFGIFTGTLWRVLVMGG